MRCRLRDQDGIALPVATCMLAVVSLLVTAFFTVAIELGRTAVRDHSQKRALAAAEAGLQAAVHRLNQIRTPAVPATHCLTVMAVPPSGIPPECPAAPVEQLGNGASFTYYVTPLLGMTGACVTLPTVTPSPTDRCVTAVGTSGDVTRRLQARVVQQPGSIGYTQLGVIGKELVYTWNSDEVHADVGSNEQVSFGNSTKLFADSSLGIEGAVKLLAGASPGYSAGPSVTLPGGVDTVATPFALPPVDFESVELANSNHLLSGSYYNASTRRFSISSGTYTMPAGTYHFCKVFLGDSVKLRFPGTGLTKIYVDSPSRPDSVCNNASATAEDGTFGADNSVLINEEVGNHEELLEIYLYGSGNESTRPRYSWCNWVSSEAKPDECKSDFMLDNSVKLWGTVYAPDSTVQAHNSIEWYGAVGANKIRFYNSVKFWLTDAVKNKPSGSQGVAVRRGWIECRSQPTTSTDPESGC